MTRENWELQRAYTPEMLEKARLVLDELRAGHELRPALRRHPLPGGGYVPKHILVAAYRQAVMDGQWSEDPTLLERIRMKPMRTLSGVTTVTVLTRPQGCPGHCIFCPDDVRMPKSYLPDEPGAARAFQNNFDPFRQVTSRLEGLQAVGHPTDKIELLILGGSWTAYPRDYQEWFILRCFDALNRVESATLAEAQAVNETAPSRNVGLVIETRPDEISPNELRWLRSLGVTKVQMGAQSLDDRILALNQRGHTSAETLAATALLRAAGFKIVLHWMPNLLGATLESDREDIARLWQGYCPDEIKIYPTQLLEGTELYAYWQRGEYHPYTTSDLIDLIADLKPTIPAYCRVNRVIRDIPSTHVVEGNKRTSLRQDVLVELARRGQRCGCIRCHEVGRQSVNPDHLTLEDTQYVTGNTGEHFLNLRTPDGQIAGYLRLSLPQPGQVSNNIAEAMPELKDTALIREVHIYGQALGVGVERQGIAQHSGLGTRLLEEASRIATESGYKHLAVIAAIGTRRYYAGRGFRLGTYYMFKSL